MLKSYHTIFALIAEHIRYENPQEALRYFKEGIEIGSGRKELKKTDFDELFEKFANKTIEINKQLLIIDMEMFLNTDEDFPKLVEKYFKLDGLTEMFLSSTNKFIVSESKPLKYNYHEKA